MKNAPDFANAPRETERRNFGRRDTFKPAIIQTLAGEVSIACYVVNISNSGALLQVRKIDIPYDVFNLLIDEDDTLVQCAVAHRTNGKIGVRFVGSPMRASRIRPERPDLRAGLQDILVRSNDKRQADN